MRTYPDPFVRRWSRRAISWGLIFVAAALMLVTSVIWVPLCFVLDLVFRGRLASERGMMFLLTYLIFDIVGMALCLWVWLRYKVVPGSSEARFHEGMYWAQATWARMLAGSAIRALGIRMHIEADYDFTAGRPVLLAARHTSIADTMVPLVYVSAAYGRRLNYVMKRELEWDPSIDLAVSRLPHLFVIRGSGDATKEIEAIGTMARLDTGDGVVIFPEGTRYTPEKREHVLHKLTESDDQDLAQWARDHEHVIVPRMGGLMALLENNAGADMVFCSHRGFENATSFREAFNGSLIDADIHVRFWGVPFEDIPEDPEERRAFLLEQWSAVDAYAAGAERD